MFQHLMHHGDVRFAQGVQPMSQYWALLSLVFMIGYVFMFDKIRWQLGRTTPRSETGTVWAPTYGGYTCHPYRK